jgi:trehalose 6-phosphate synthase
MHFRREDYEGYLSVNRSFAASLAPMLQGDDTVWAHDYHLIPFARLLRKQGFEGRIGFFLHVPFVPPSMLEAMPVARELVADLCAYDVVGFQTEEHARDFRDCAHRLLGATVEGEWIRLAGRRVRAFADPIGIDAQGLCPGRRARRRRQGSAAGRREPVESCPRDRRPTGWTIPRDCRTASRHSAA